MNSLSTHMDLGFSEHCLVRRPVGRVPSDVKSWLEVHEPWTGWRIAVCRCGKWYSVMDHLAPYHTEMNWCKTCGFESPYTDG